MKNTFAVFLTITVNLLGASQIRAQSNAETKAPLIFEVASVKPSESGLFGGVRPTEGGQRYVARGVPVRFMIKLMYHIVDDQIVGGPAWMNTERFDVEGRAGRPSSLRQLQEMFQTLVADRFRLQFHRETKQLPAFALTVDKTGPKLTANDNPDEVGDVSVGPSTGKLPGMYVRKASMSYLCWHLAQFPDVGRPVLDRTDLKGYYDFKLEFAPQTGGMMADGGGEAPHTFFGPSIFTALREQLGLKLVPEKGPVEIFVIDRIERPSSN
jgi:uncharacterized protein (TIGR03435 family)